MTFFARRIIAAAAISLQKTKTFGIGFLASTVPVGLQRSFVHSFGFAKSSTTMHSIISRTDYPNVSIITVPATADNFMYLIVDKTSGQAAAVDPVEPARILETLKGEEAELTAILTTHHHWDHAGGNNQLVELYAKETGKTLEVYGGDSRVEGLTKKVEQNDKLKIGSLNIDCHHTPCHTSGHICYFLHNNDAPAVFTGDTLFIAGCGRFFEGTAPQMFDALINKLGSLPDSTMVFCGHEYTISNLKFALSLEPGNEDAKEKLAWAEAQRAVRKPTVPSTIEEEKKINPFMRVTLSSLQQKVGTDDAVSCMGKVRSMKDSFKASI